MLLEDGRQCRKVPRDALRLHMAALADSDIDAIEAQFSDGLGQRFTAYKLEVLGKNRDLQLLFRRQRIGYKRAAHQGCAAGQHGAAGGENPVRIHIP